MKSQKYHIMPFLLGKQSKEVSDCSMLDAIYKRRRQPKRIENTTKQQRGWSASFCVNIKQRGHCECEEVDNKGKFFKILEMIEKHDPLVQEVLTYYFFSPTKTIRTSKCVLHARVLMFFSIEWPLGALAVSFMYPHSLSQMTIHEMTAGALSDCRQDEKKCTHSFAFCG